MSINRILLAVLAALTAVQCSNDGKAAQVSMTVNPKQPIVFTGNFTIPGTTSVVSSPWFEFTVSVNNNSNEAVTIIGIQVTVNGTTTSGQTVTNTKTLLPSDLNTTLACTGGTTYNLTYSSFGTISPNSSMNLQFTIDPTVAAAAPAACTLPTASTATFFVGGNPDIATSKVQNYSYQVQLQPEGWFGTLIKPADRFVKTVYFSTK
jgi:hypothetical protein